MEPGGARREPAGELLPRLLPVLEAAGITRVAVLTGLDALGVPVAAAIRPNSRSIAVHQGKGATTEAAKVAAIMEAIECHCAEQAHWPLRLGTAAEMADAGAPLDVARLPRASGGGDPFAARLLWIEGRDLLSGEAVWAPHETVSADWSRPEAARPCFQASTNGLGAGLTLDAATLHGVREVIERDAVALWRARPDSWRANRVVDPATIDGPASRCLLDQLSRAGAWTVVWDATSDVGAPVFAVLLGDESGRLQPELGFACHADPDAALWRALLEAAQSRLTVISGARDDFSDDDYESAARARFARAQRRIRPTRAFGETVGIADGLPPLLEALTLVGISQLACVDLSRAETAPVRVARIVVPGLEGGHTGPDGEYAPGARARAVAG